MAFCIVHARDIWARGLFARLPSAWVPTLLALLLFDGLRFQYFAAGIPGLGYGDHPENVPVGWRELGRQVHSIAQHAASRPLIVGMDRYFLASELAFYAPDPNAANDVTAAHLFGHVGLMYGRWTSPTAVRGRALLLISWDADDLDSPEVRAGVEELGSIQEGELRRDERLVRRYYYRFAYGYLGIAPTSLELRIRPALKGQAFAAGNPGRYSGPLGIRSATRPGNCRSGRWSQVDPA
jgi:dolichol-phosphate mannosyltransferase